MRSQSLSLQMSPSRGKVWERRQFLVKAEIQSPFAASVPVNLAESGRRVLLSGGRRWWRTGRRSYRSRCPRTGRCSGLEEAEWSGLPLGDQAQSFGWLVGTNSPAKNPKVRQGKSQSIPPQRVIYIFIYNILSTQTEWRQGHQLDLLLWREREIC